MTETIDGIDPWAEMTRLERENASLREALKDASMWINDDDQSALEYKTKWRALCS